MWRVVAIGRSGLGRVRLVRRNAELFFKKKRKINESGDGDGDEKEHLSSLSSSRVCRASGRKQGPETGT